MTDPCCYSVDTSALLDGLERFYFEDAFPGIWEKVAVLIAAGRFFVSEEVWVEAKKKTGVVKTWCEKDTTGRLIVPTDGVVIREVQSILAAFPRLVGQVKGRNEADAFVIAIAKLRRAKVVTGEGDDGNDNHPKIPFICRQLGINCLRFTDLIRSEGWKFRAD